MTREPLFHIVTLGCRVNQYDEDRLRAEFRGRGFREVDLGGSPDVVVVNTCTVTHVADKKSRQLIRRALRENPQARVIATGCAVGNRHALARIPERVIQVANRDKERLVDLVRAEIPEHHQVASPGAGSVSFRARALLKVQDGCDQFCSFCIVPFVRGRSRSRPVDEVMAEARALVGAGLRELVVTGVHVGAYGRDLEPPLGLGFLMRRLAEESGAERVRLSSIEPADFPMDLLDTMERTAVVCPHLHLALQHASDRVLERMRRGYTRAHCEGIVSDFFRRFPDGALTADILVGFPGEEDEDFDALCRLVEEIDFAHLHVFPYSPRPGTAASRYPGRLSPEVMERRMIRILDLGRRKEEAFRQRFVGRTVSVLVEATSDGWHKGTTDNYLSVRFEDAGTPVGDVRSVLVEAVLADGLQGRAVI